MIMLGRNVHLFTLKLVRYPSQTPLLSDTDNSKLLYFGSGLQAPGCVHHHNPLFSMPECSVGEVAAADVVSFGDIY